MKGVRAAVEERLVVVRADAEDLDPARLDELADGVDQPVAMQLPLVAVARREGQQRRPPVAEDRDAHVVAQTRRIPDVMFDVHECVLLTGSGIRDRYPIDYRLVARGRSSQPHSARPGLAPVCSPSLSTCVPLTNTWRMPTAY